MARARQKGGGRGTRAAKPAQKLSSGDSSPLSSAAGSPPPTLDDAELEPAADFSAMPLPMEGINPLAFIEGTAGGDAGAGDAEPSESDMAALQALLDSHDAQGGAGLDAMGNGTIPFEGIIDTERFLAEPAQTDVGIGGGDPEGDGEGEEQDEDDGDADDDEEATADGEDDDETGTPDVDDDGEATVHPEDIEMEASFAEADVEAEDAGGDDTDSDTSSHGKAAKVDHSYGAGAEYVYPAPMGDYADVPSREKKFRAGRFLACQVSGCSCTGMEPPRGSIIHLSVGDPVDQAMIKANKNMTEEGWWRLCGVCGHGWEGTGHVFPESVDGSERERRGRVMSRIEELLADEELLEHFPAPRLQSYESLYKQLQPFQRPAGGKRPAAPLPPAIDITTPQSGIMDLDDDLPMSGDEVDTDADVERPTKRRRTSKSLERSPLAETTNADGSTHGKKPTGGKTSGKDRMPRTVVRGARGLVAMETEADGSQHPGGHLPDSAARANGEEGAEEEDEDVPLAAQRPQLDEGERKRREMIKEKEREREDQMLRNKEEGEQEGEVDVWEGIKLTKLPPRPAAIEEAAREIVLMVVGSRNPTPVATILLIGLKNLFQKQLPKMPREYITRLVLDKNHIGMAIVKRGWKVVGGICYRPFESRGFAEIVFCAVDSSEQIKGYGGHLMNSLKDHVRKAHPTINYFLTYADNYAVGYFKKQGFTKEISYPREKWVGYIKDYEGGTIMQCKMLPKVKYSEVHQMLADQKAAVLAKIKSKTRGHIVYPGLEVFKDKKPDQEIHLQKQDVPGLKETGWDPAVDALLRQPRRNPYHGTLQLILDDLQNEKSAWPFAKPVDTSVVQDYHNVIDFPMDLSTMETKLENNHYESVEAFLLDCQLIFSNCRKYNGDDSTYTVQANKLEKALDKILKKRLANAPA